MDTTNKVLITAEEEGEDLKSACDDSWRNVPRGRPKSGRLWKDAKPVSKSKIFKCQSTLRSTWNQKVEARAKNKSIKDFENNLKEAKKKMLEEKRIRAEQRKKARLERQQKAEIVQQITNTKKIKYMKKKQLRFIEKR